MARTKPAKANAKKTLQKAKTKPAKAPKTASKAAPSGDLGAIAKAIATKNVPAALDAALVAWRATRAPSLADLADAIATRITGAPITTDLEWTRIAAAGNPHDLGRLLAGIRELPVSFLPTVSQRLALYPDDPRIARAAGDWVLDPPTTSTSAYPFWTKLYDLLVKLGDTRAIKPLAKRVAMPPKETQPWKGAKPKPSQFWAKFYAALDKTRGQLEEIAVPTVDKDAISKLVKQVGSLAMVEGGAPAAKPAKKADGPPLVQALAHAKAGRVDAAIEAMLDAWRDKRAPEIADLIDRASRLLPGWDLPFPVESKAAHAAWQAAFAADPTRNLPQLIRHAIVGGSSAAVEHLASLATLPDDPRIALRLAELSSTHNISPEKTHYWKTCWDIIARARDVRVIAPLRQHFRDFTGTYYDHHKSGRRIVGDFVLGELPPSPLDASDHGSIGQIATALATLEATAHTRERELIADIVSHWSDEGPRLVYADWLTERGNLRGELIVLDCKLAREGKLSTAESKQLGAMRTSFRSVTYVFGPISDLHPQLDRGLPTKLTVEYNSSPITWRYLLGYPLLACIDTINCTELADTRGRPRAADLARVMLDPTATRLAHVISVPNDEHGLLASELEPLVKPAWRRDNYNFTR